MKTMATVLAFTLTGFFALSTAWAQAYGDKEHAELAKALKDAKVSLQHGLTASAKEGNPSPRSTRWKTANSSSRSTR
jgi:hypothetical protein